MSQQQTQLGNEPAYPVAKSANGAQLVYESTGMTKREVIAMHAMQAVVESGNYADFTFAEVIRESVRYADALLAALAEGSER